MRRTINLHYLLPQPLNDAVVALNQALVKACGSEVDFGLAGRHIPHVTLFKGTPAGDTPVETLVDVLKAQIPRVPRFVCQIASPYLKPDRPNWAFLDVLPLDPLIHLKQRILNAVSSLIEAPTWDYAAEVPHITVGYLMHSHSLAPQYFEQFICPEQIELERVQISHTGIRGTCVEPIAEYPLLTSA